MQQFVKEANIRLFEAKLAETSDSNEREKLQRLIAEERAKPAAPSGGLSEARTKGRGD